MNSFASLRDFASSTGHCWLLLPPAAPPNSRVVVFLRRIHESYGVCTVNAIELTARRLVHRLNVTWPHAIVYCERIDYNDGRLTFDVGDERFTILVDRGRTITLTSGEIKLETVEAIGIRRALDILLGEHAAQVQAFDPLNG